jgi:hypothetical protein
LDSSDAFSLGSSSRLREWPLLVEAGTLGRV